MERKREIEPPPPHAVISGSKSEGLDFISQLPDCVLCSSILSLLPIKDSARTTILSSRWRHLWKVAPLRLDDSSLLPDKLLRHRTPPYLPRSNWTSEAVSTIFSSHHGPLHSLRLSRFPNAASSYSTVDRFVDLGIQRGIRELTLEFDCHLGFYELSPSLLHSESLHHLSLVGCRFPEPVLPSVFLPNLKELRLSDVKLSDHSLQTLLSNCRSLETLHLFSCGKPPVVTINSPRLRKLVCWLFDKELIIENAPKLESLMLGENMTDSCKVMVRYAPQLEILGFVCVDFDKLQLGETCFKQQRDSLEPITIDITAMPCRMKMLSSVRTLAIKMRLSPDSSKIIIPSILRCFPCLENLDVLNCNSGFDGGYNCWEEEDSFSFLDHLKTVTVKSFYGHQTEVEFLRYFVLHGKVLQKMILLCSKYDDKKFVERKSRHLCMEKRASSGLELFFRGNTWDSDYFSLWNELINVIHY